MPQKRAMGLEYWNDDTSPLVVVLVGELALLDPLAEPDPEVEVIEAVDVAVVLDVPKLALLNVVFLGIAVPVPIEAPEAPPAAPAAVVDAEVEDRVALALAADALDEEAAKIDETDAEIGSMPPDTENSPE